MSEAGDLTFTFGEQSKPPLSIADENVLMNALAAYEAANPSSSTICRQMMQAYGPKVVARYVKRVENEAVLRSLEEAAPKKPTFRNERDKILVMRALAALSTRAESSDQRKNQIQEFCIASGIDLEAFDDAVAELKTPDDPEANLEWRTKEGRTMRIADMEDSHLINAIKFMERSAKVDAAGEILLMYALLAFKPSAKLRDLIAAESAKEKPEAPPMYWALRREAARRGYNLGTPGVKDEAKGDGVKRTAAPKPGGRMFNFEE